MSGLKIGLAVVALAIGMPVACTAYNAYTAPARVINKTLNTNNIIFNYERFFDINANFKSKVAQIKQYKSLYESEINPAEKNMLRTEMAAMQQSCRDLANSYNADSAKLNKSIFKSNDLPVELNSTECE